MPEKRSLAHADLVALYEIHAHGSVQQINESPGDQLPPMLLACWMGPTVGHIEEMMVLDPRFVVRAMESNRKERLMSLIDGLLAHGQSLRNLTRDDVPPLTCAPDAVVHISEAWAVAGTSGKKGMDEAMAESCRTKGKSLATHPDRKEVLLINVYSSLEQLSGICRIEGSGAERHATYAPMFEGELADGSALKRATGVSHVAH